MRTLRLLSVWLLLSSLAAANYPTCTHCGTWTVYETDVETTDESGNLVITPTVGITGDDGGFCAAFYPWEFPLVMLQGNAWVAGYGQPGAAVGGGQLSFAYTFPNVTIAPGQTADMSFAAKVEGYCPTVSGSEGYTLAEGFYLRPFLDGEYENDPLGNPIPPTACWLEGYLNNTPTCALPWPLPTSSPAVGYDLDSQQVSFTVRIAIATYALATVNENGTATYTLSCPNGNQNATCGSANLLGSQAHLWAEEYTIYSQPGGCFFANLVQYLDGPPAPKNCE